MRLDELPIEKQEAYLEFTLLLRQTLGQIENLQARVELVTTLWTAQIQAIHDEISAGTVIPDNTNYPNAGPMTKADVTSGTNLLAAILALRTIETTRRAVLAVGPNRIMQPAGEGSKRRPGVSRV